MSQATWGFLGVIVGVILTAFLNNHKERVARRFEAWSAWAGATRIAIQAMIAALLRTDIAIPEDAKKAITLALSRKQDDAVLREAYFSMLKAEANLLLIERDRTLRDEVLRFSHELYQPAAIREANKQIDVNAYKGTSHDLFVSIVKSFERLTTDLDTLLLTRAPGIGALSQAKHAVLNA